MTSKTETQPLVARPGRAGVGWGELSGLMLTGCFFLSHRFRIYSNQSTLETLAVSWERWVGRGWGQGEQLRQTCPFPPS